MCYHKFFILILMGFFLSGCIAKSAYVNRNSELIADNGEVIAVLQKKIAEKFPDIVSPQDLQRAITNAKAQIEQANKSSSLVSKEALAAAAKTVTKSVSGYFGIPPGIVEGVLGMLGVSGIWATRREKKKRRLVAGLDPEEGKKQSDLMDV